MAGNNNRRPRPQPQVNMAEHHVDEQRKAEQAGGLAKLFGPKEIQHRPILKALEDLGIQRRITPVMLGDEPTDCLVIPTQELIAKEYEKLSGVNLEQFNVNATTVQPKQEQFNVNATTVQPKQGEDNE